MVILQNIKDKLLKIPNLKTYVMIANVLFILILILLKYVRPSACDDNGE